MITSTDSDGRTRIAVTGELDLSSVPQLRTCLSDLVLDGHLNLVLDLQGVTFCDSAGLGVFVGAHRRVTNSGGTLEFQNLLASLRTLLSVSGLDQLLTVA